MWYEWLIFGAVFLLIPIAVANLKLIAEKKINPTEDQKKNASLLCGFLILFYWLCDLFYMAFILDNLALKFIFGGLVMVIIFYNLSTAFVSGAPTFKWGLIQDFVVGVIMSIYLVYIIPSSDLKEVVIPIVSAVYGGLITLVGVAWTIRKTDNDRKSEEKKKAEPVFTFNLLLDDSLPETRIICTASVEEIDGQSYANHALIVNSDNSNFFIKAIKYQGTWYSVSQSNYVLRNQSIYFVFYTPQIRADHLAMYVQMEDVLGYKHYYKFKYNIRNSKKGKPYTSMVALEKVTEEEANG